MIQPKPLNQPILDRPDRLTRSVHTSAQPLWVWVAVSLPVIVFALVWQYYAVNVPKWDDHALRYYLYLFDQETTVSGKIYQLFKQHNEHRIVYDRIIATLDYWLFGKMSYVHLMVVGNLSLVGLLAIFGSVLLRAGKSLLYLVPVSLLLFNLSHWENMFWGMAALQNFSVVFWVVLTIYCLSYTNRWGLALLSAVLATLTSGNGLLVWPLGLVLLLLQLPAYQRRVDGKTNRPGRLLVGWIVVGVLVITLYFVGFAKPAGNPPDRGPLTDLLKGWLAFTGAAAEALPTSSPLSVSIRLGGLMVLATLGLGVWSLRTYWAGVTNAIRHIFRAGTSHSSTANSIPSTVLFFWGCVAFILGTAAIVAWTRTGFGLDLIYTSRYKIYSLTLLALLYVYAAVALPDYAGRWVSVAGGLGSLLIAWLSHNAYVDDTIWWRHWMLTDQQFNWTYTTNRPIGQLDAITKHYTTPAPAFYDTNPAIFYGTSQAPTMPVTITKTPTGFEVNQATLTIQDQRDSRAYVVVRSPKRTYLFPTRQHQNLNKRTRFWPANPFTTGFAAPIAATDVAAGQYEVLILTVDPNGQMTLHPTGQTIASLGQTVAPIQKNW